ncbi:isoaspartyl peptidase/L-asparaginase [Thorsellia anophelis]|uniref:Isoaspartyl peptidase or L-asparaginase, Ntn-hydrolase superfamily n=1 Tax=Thorsellia anophelis DSM 18579 TaxID=1123402 RepID=A0A1I0EHX0_9GAMM|nr:isoaspartyl peptidase/L-asparaginase [Thorsellia anophelis]SET44992.1 Isoaspartyl peptidase or L-asparaginase, Ntn-hydrolase superfamily [Thorsellia anophelis DSM 18579]
MRNCIIGAWRMSHDAINHARLMLENNQSIGAAIERAMMEMESNPDIYCAGLGALPNRDGVVELDAAYMDGDTLGFGAVTCAVDIMHPSQIAQSLSIRKIDSVRAGKAVTQYAEQRSMPIQNILTDEAKYLWQKSIDRKLDKKSVRHFGAVAVLGIDKEGSIAAALSGSDWFMKRSGVVSHVPMLGCGCYADSSIGAAVAVGSGDDIMKGSLSYEVIRLLSTGISAQLACETALRDHYEKLDYLGKTSGSMSLIAIDRMGRFGCATNYPDGFIFVVSDQGAVPAIYICTNQGFACEVKPISQMQLAQYDEEYDAYLKALRS